MISKYKFLKESKKLKLSEELLGFFYDGFEIICAIIKNHYENFENLHKDNWKKITEEDWTKLLEIEEKLQWPILKELHDSSLTIYTDADPANFGESTLFRNSINGEIVLRKGKFSTNSNDYRSGLKFFFQQRFEFLLTIFEVDKKTKWWLLAAAGAGIALAGGAYLLTKDRKVPDEENKKP